MPPPKKPPRVAGLKKAINLAIEAAEGRRRLGRLLGISHQAIGSWDRVPAERLVDIEVLTGVGREVLRPDLYQGFRRIRR
jgi:hypothetical protein